VRAAPSLSVIPRDFSPAFLLRRAHDRVSGPETPTHVNVWVHTYMTHVSHVRHTFNTQLHSHKHQSGGGLRRGRGRGGLLTRPA